MHPNPAHDDLSAYLDGELTADEVARIEVELARDPALREALTELETVSLWLREEGVDQAPLGFHHAVMTRIDTEDPPPRPLWSWLRRPFGVPIEGWLVAGAAAAVLFLALPGSSPDSSEWPTFEPEAATSPAALELPLPSTEPPAVEDPYRQVLSPPSGEADATVDVGSEPAMVDGTPPPPVPREKGSPAEPTTVANEVQSKGLQKSIGTGVDDPTGETEGTADLSSPGYTYTVRSADPNMKRAVLALAGRYGGARTASGSEIEAAQMASNQETLVIQVPQDRLNMFGKELASLGYAVERSKDTALLPGSLMPVRITLLLEGGSTTPRDGGANAAQKRRTDFAEEMLEDSIEE